MKFVTPQEVVYQRSVIAAARAARATKVAGARARPVQRARSIAPQSNDVTPVINFVVINPKK